MSNNNPCISMIFNTVIVDVISIAFSAQNASDTVKMLRWCYQHHVFFVFVLIKLTILY